MNHYKEPSRALRPDAQAFDEVRIETVPRYKTSGLSGDEWRISARLAYYRNGNLLHERSFRNVETACGFAWTEYVTAIDDGKGYFAGEDDICDQEGCREPATIMLQKDADWCQRCGKQERKYGPAMGPFRRFCEKHKTRGDCGLDDADRNYTVVQVQEQK